jgi:hypothetical protein
MKIHFSRWLRFAPVRHLEWDLKKHPPPVVIKTLSYSESRLLHVECAVCSGAGPGVGQVEHRRKKNFIHEPCMSMHIMSVSLSDDLCAESLRALLN